MIVLLYTTAMPFTPMQWVLGFFEGAYLIDSLFAGIILLSALYFQFAMAGLNYPVAVALPNVFAQGSDNYIRNGRMGAKPTDSEMVFFYHPSSYWTYIIAEVGLLFVANFGPMELLRRVIVSGIIGALWAVGWMITPQSTKKWAWDHIKAFWFFIVLDLLRDIGQGGGRRRRR